MSSGLRIVAGGLLLALAVPLAGGRPTVAAADVPTVTPMFAMGGNHSCGVTSSGTVSCWGLNNDGMSTAPPGTYSSVAVGAHHTCGLHTDGTIECWGGESFGEATAPTGTFLSVTAGEYHSCGLRTDHTVTCWGWNGEGQKLVPPGTYDSVSTAVNATCGLHTDGTAECWGAFDAPILVERTGVFTAIAVGADHACGLRPNNTVQCWGSNAWGYASPPGGTFIALQASCGIRPDHTLTCWGPQFGTPPTVANVQFASFSGGWYRGCGLGLDGLQHCWNNGTTTDEPTIGEIASISAFHTHSCVIRVNLTLKCWGDNELGAAQSPAGTFRSVSLAMSRTCAIRTNGVMACWGSDDYHAATAQPGSFMSLDMGTRHGCAVRTNGTIACWGLIEPGKIPSGTFTSVTSGNDFSCAIRTAGTLACWASWFPLQFVTPTGQFTSVTAGDLFICGVRPSGQVECFGNNNYGQLDAPNELFASVSAGNDFACGITVDGSLRCWGNNSNMLSPTPAGSYLSISSAMAQACAVRSDHVMQCWGRLAMTGEPIAPEPAANSHFGPFLAARLMETRINDALGTADGQFQNIGVRSAGSTTELVVAGRGAVPSDARAAMLNVTVNQPAAGGFVSIYPCGTDRPTASNVNFSAGQTIANSVTAAIGVDGKVCVYTSATAHVIIDVSGYYAADAAFGPLTPARLLETRVGTQFTTIDGLSQGIGERAAGSVTELVVAGRGEVPAGAIAAALNVTVTRSTANGYVSVYPCGTARPNSSNVNFAANQTVANSVTAKIGTGGKVCIYTSAATHLIVDVSGFHEFGSTFGAITPKRLMETRVGPGMTTVDGLYQAIDARAGNTVTELVVAGRGTVPLSASAVILNLTVISPQGNGYLSVYPCGSAVPNSSNVNFSAGRTIAGSAYVPLGTGGTVCIYTSVSTDLVVDVNGYFP